jgi:DNA-binding SARP family transcriptional activator
VTRRLKVSVLGPVEVRVDGTPVPVSGARVRMLLARLAMGEGSTVSSGDLAEAVWDGAPPADPTNALQTLVSRLRRALGWAGAVVPR